MVLFLLNLSFERPKIELDNWSSKKVSETSSAISSVFMVGNDWLSWGIIGILVFVLFGVTWIWVVLLSPFILGFTTFATFSSLLTLSGLSFFIVLVVIFSELEKPESYEDFEMLFATLILL